MIEVTVFRKMRKDFNSTKIPNIGDFEFSNIYSCALWDDCSVQSPVIIISADLAVNMAGYNYAFIPSFNRYYWITNIRFNDGRWFLHLSCDVLASFKNDIGTSNQYIIRSESDYDENITDTAYTPTGGKGQSFNLTTNPFATNMSNGNFVIGITSASPTIGSNRYVVMNENQLSAFCSQLMGSGDYLNLDSEDLSSAMVKTILNPIQYIQSVRWFPFTISGTTAGTTIFFGWWIIQASHGDLLTSSELRRDFEFTIPIPKHPQISTHGAYLQKSPYSQYRIQLPILGYVDLDSNLLYGYTGLRVKYTVDLVTGLAYVSISAYESGGDRETDVYITSCQIGIDIPIAQITTDFLSAAKGAGGLASGLAQALTGNIAGGISTIINGAIDAGISSQTPIPAFLGAPGNLASFSIRPRLDLISQEMTDTAFGLYGRPLCAIRQINTLSGFIMCNAPHLELPNATSTELEQAETFLSSGFRWE